MNNKKRKIKLKVGSYPWPFSKLKLKQFFSLDCCNKIFIEEFENNWE